MDYNSILVFIGAFCFGYIFSQLFRKLMDKISDDIMTKKINLVYSELLNNVYTNKTIFKSRINNTVSLETFIEVEGKINIMYMMDKKDIAIFKNDVCIYTSNSVSSDLLNSLVTAIDFHHKDKIFDVVNIMGLIFSREEFETKFNLKVEDLKKGAYVPMQVSNIDNILNDNEKKFDIDSILDRISEVGIDNLTADEKNFLKNYK
jgi:hypothetical protein